MHIDTLITFNYVIVLFNHIMAQRSIVIVVYYTDLFEYIIL